MDLAEDAPVHRYVCLKPMQPSRTITELLRPPDAEHANPYAHPIWGEFVRMVTDGGERKGKRTKDRYLAKSGRSWTEPDGSISGAADPLVSNDDIIMAIARAMYWCGWTLDQVRIVMLDPANKGCQAWRDAMQLQKDPEAWELRLWRNIIENDWRRLPVGPVKVKPEYERKMPSTKKLAALLDWIATNPDQNQTALLKSGRIRGRQRWVLDTLEAEGKIRRVVERRPDKVGRMQQQTFWRLADDHPEVQDAREFAIGRTAAMAEQAERFALVSERVNGRGVA